MTRFNMFTDEELDAMEGAFCNEGLGLLIDEIRMERRLRENRKRDKRMIHQSRSRIFV